MNLGTHGSRARLRLGIMGGTFDPIHAGHLVAAEEVRVRMELDQVVFMVAGQPPHKTTAPVTSGEDRYLMTVLATASNPAFDVSRMEIDRSGPTYTVDTVLALRDELGDEVDFFFITGADAVWEIIGWDRAELLADLVTFVGVTRPGYDLEAERRKHEEENTRFRIEYLEVPALAISSTDLRSRVAQGLSIRYLTPDSIVSYIAKRGLYGGGRR